jgi:hypothetical protein
MPSNLMVSEVCLKEKYHFERFILLSIPTTGSGTLIAEEGSAIYQVVKDTIEESRGEFTHLEEAVKEQMSEKPKKKRRKKASPKASASSTASNSGVNDFLGGLPADFNLDDISGSDSD